MYNSILPVGNPINLIEAMGGNRKLPPGVYKVVYDSNTKKLDFYKLPYDKFKLPNKIYGKLPNYAKHFWYAYRNSKNNLGVILTGEKGTGKTELAKLISNLAIDDGYPVIMVDEAGSYDIAKLHDLLENLGDVVVFFDEFGKNFYMGDQNRLLTTLTSDSGGKKLFLITENKYYNLSPFIRSRPGRARYHLDFKKLESDIVKEYLDEHVSDSKFKEDVLRVYEKSTRFTFDYLKALVEEHKLFPDMKFEEMSRYLNIDEIRTEFYVIITDAFKVDDKGNKKEVYMVLQNTIPKLEDFEESMIPISVTLLKEDKSNNEDENPALIPETMLQINVNDIIQEKDKTLTFEKEFNGVYYRLVGKIVPKEEMIEFRKLQSQLKNRKLPVGQGIQAANVNQQVNPFV